MREFFNGWRRKAGCSTLVMACALMGMWIRSVSVVDMIEYPASDYAVWSTIGSIVLQRSHAENAIIRGYYPIWHTLPPKILSAADPRLKWQWRCCGFGVAEPPPEQTEKLGISKQFVFMPYWAVVIPPTFISAYLILLKPGKVAVVAVGQKCETSVPETTQPSLTDIL